MSILALCVCSCIAVAEPPIILVDQDNTEVRESCRLLLMLQSSFLCNNRR